jgi:cold shock CspA family protein
MQGSGLSNNFNDKNTSSTIEEEDVKKEIMITAKEVQVLTQQALRHNQKIMLGKNDPTCQA